MNISFVHSRYLIPYIYLYLYHQSPYLYQTPPELNLLPTNHTLRKEIPSPTRGFISDFWPRRRAHTAASVTRRCCLLLMLPLLLMMMIKVRLTLLIKCPNNTRPTRCSRYLGGGLDEWNAISFLFIFISTVYFGYCLTSHRVRHRIWIFYDQSLHYQRPQKQPQWTHP